MSTIPTGKMERDLRALYLKWVAGLDYDDDNMAAAVSVFERQANALIASAGGNIARMGAMAGFPAPRLLSLDPHINTVYNAMEQAAVAAGIASGLNSRMQAQAMFRAGMDQSYRRLELIARTETVRAYWANAWGSIADLPDLVMVWGAEIGPRTCLWCKERDGLVIESDSLRDHPNGRCTPIPTLRTLVEYKGSVRADGTIYRDPDWGKVEREEAGPTAPLPMTEPEVPAASDVGYVPREVVPESDMLDRSKNWAPGTTMAERNQRTAAQSAAEYYGSATGYKDMNSSLRATPGTKGAARLGEIEEALIAPLSDALYAQQTTQAMTVNRGLKDLAGLRAMIPRGGSPADLVGEVFEERGFMSTSYQPAVNNFGLRPNQMVITIPPGTYGARMDGFYESAGMGDQYEFLMPPGGRIQVTSVVQTGVDVKGRPTWEITAVLISQREP